ncbi:MAG: hypothetical protein ACRC2T_10905, partial [Thermoguttaceae bacterium]
MTSQNYLKQLQVFETQIQNGTLNFSELKNFINTLPLPSKISSKVCDDYRNMVCPALIALLDPLLAVCEKLSK